MSLSREERKGGSASLLLHKGVGRLITAGRRVGSSHSTPWLRLEVPPHSCPHMTSTYILGMASVNTLTLYQVSSNTALPVWEKSFITCGWGVEFQSPQRDPTDTESVWDTKLQPGKDGSQDPSFCLCRQSWE